MNAYQIIEKKRNAQALTDQEIAWFIRGLGTDEVADYQTTALLMATFINGMTPEETLALTRAMLESGKSLSFHDPSVVDKHSTGGIGDKASFVIGPLAAACGAKVPMITGRGLGHTGGTADKAESIPGFKIDIPLEEVNDLIQKHGLVLMAQTNEIAPADKKLYALRDVTATVNSIPLITASIMSKKLAEGISGLVIDVKHGSGAFMKTVDESCQLAQSLMATGKQYGVKTIAFITNMESPLGNTVGHSLEIIECVETLRGQGPKDLEELSLKLAAGMIYLAGKTGSLEEGEDMARQALNSGAAMEKFMDVVRAQGGNTTALSRFELLSVASERHCVQAKSEGYIASFENHRIGHMLLELGGGRKQKTDAIDFGVGFKFAKKPGDAIKPGETIFNIYHHPAQKKLAATLEEYFFTHVMEVSQSPPPAIPLISQILS